METRSRKAPAEPGKESAGAAKTDNAQPPKREKKVIFEYPDLPKWEIGIYFSVVIGALIWAAYMIYEATNTFDYHHKTGWGWRRKIPFPVIGDWWRDMSNYEWRQFQPQLSLMFCGYVAHSLVFNITGHFWAKSNPRLWEACRLAVALAFYLYGWGPRVVANAVFVGLVLFFTGLLTNRRWCIWLVAAPLIWATFEYAKLISGWKIAFMPIWLTSYKMLTYISFCFETFPREAAKGETKRSFVGRALWDMFVYASYLPYSLSLICIYPRYQEEIRSRSERSRHWPCLAFRLARLAFWTLFIEFLLRVAHFEILLTDLEFLKSTRLVTFMGLGWAAGQFFHLKYVIIWGLPSLFASLDLMDPLPGPVCVPRLSLFSHMWRGFDRGLYQFFIRYIFTPIAGPSFTLPRKLVGMLTSYGFVLLWHGLYRNYIMWTLLNIGELVSEQAGKGLYTIPAVRSFREKHLSDRNFRRLIAFTWIVPYSFSFYSSYYFLAGARQGDLMLDRMFWANLVPWTRFYQLVFLLCYCHSQTNMSIDRYYAQREEAQRQQKEAKAKAH